MSFKKIFTPTSEKVLLSMITVLILFAMPIVPVMHAIMCITSPCDPVFSHSSTYSLASAQPDYIIYTSSTYIVIALEIILSYILCCIMVYAANDSKSSKEYLE